MNPSLFITVCVTKAKENNETDFLCEQISDSGVITLNIIYAFLSKGTYVG